MTLWFCGRDPRAPWSARLLALALAAYALSPIDLIPDFVPVLGYLDEAILLPAGIWLCLRLMPPDLVADGRRQAEAWFEARRERPRSLAGAAFILLLWAGGAFLLWHWLR